MKSKIVFWCIFFFGSDYLVKINGLPELSEATPESHPFHAVVETSSSFCGGILITNNYVLTLASCVNGSTNVTVHLGFYECPFYESNHLDQNTQIIPSSVIIHEDFAKINRQYLNNIALLKLSQPVTLTKRVQPGTLLSRQENYLVEGKHAEVSGWLGTVNNKKKIGTVQIRNRDTCRYLFGDDYLSLGSQQFCVKWLTKTHLDVVGNSVRIGDNIIGFQTYSLSCSVETFDCSEHDTVLNFIPFLNWMSHKMNVSIEEFTSKSHESSDNQDLIKLKSSVKKMNETFYNDNKKFENILIQEALDERLGYVNTTIKNILSKQDHFQSQFKEEFKDHLSHDRDSFAKLEKTVVDTVKAVEDIKLEVQNRLGEIEKAFNEKKHRMEEYIAQESTLHQSLKAEIKSMNARLNKIIGFIYNDPFST